MTNNPFLNALVALAYISAVVLVIFNIPKEADQGGNILVPIIVLSVFVLSAASMSFIFFLQPFRLYFDGKQKEAIELIAKTMGSFALTTLLMVALLFFFFRT